MQLGTPGVCPAGGLGMVGVVMGEDDGDHGGVARRDGRVHRVPVGREVGAGVDHDELT